MKHVAFEKELGEGGITESGAKNLFGVLKFSHLPCIIQGTKPKFLLYF